MSGGRLARYALDSHVLVALHVLFLTAIAFCRTRANYEDGVFERIVAAHVAPDASKREAALALNHAVHDMLAASNRALGRSTGRSRAWPFSHSLTGRLVEGGSCGTHSGVLARALQLADIDVRVVQLEAHGNPGAHIVVSAHLDGRWAVLDPLFDMAFVDPQGRLAGVDDLQTDWDRYAEQVPERYNLAANYHAVRYTNWRKIPVVMPALRAVLAALWGESQIETFSLRAHVLNVNRSYAVGLMLLYLPLLALSLAKLRARQRRTSNPVSGPSLPTGR